MKLMHCPFCGESDDFGILHDSSAAVPPQHRVHTCSVRCGSCGAQGPATDSTRELTARDTSEAYWNNRLHYGDDLALRTAFALGQ